MSEDSGRQEEAKKKLPVDVQLLTDAIIELNISRRSVGLYPRGHPLTRESVGRAFEFLQELFELRPRITLGIANDFLMVDNLVLDRKNPVFKEFATSLHQHGVAGITFATGMSVEELVGLHELMVDREVTPQTMLQAAEEKGIRNISITPLDLSKLAFVEGGERPSDDGDLWHTFVSGLIEGSLAGDAEGVVASVPPEQIARYVNKAGVIPAEAYDRIITAYLKRRQDGGTGADRFGRFIRFVDTLNPELKKQFLSGAFNRPSLDLLEVGQILGELSEADIDRLMGLFMDHSSLIPESIRNLLEKLEASKDILGHHAHVEKVIDDIEVGEEIRALFGEDRFQSFVAQDYREDLAKMLSGPRARWTSLASEIVQACNEETVQGRFSDLVLELMEMEVLEPEDYQKLLGETTALVSAFLDTGRFRAISDIYSTVLGHSLSGRYKDEAKAMIEDTFRSKDFVERFITAVKLWGRFDREGVTRMVQAQKEILMDPLFKTLDTADSAPLRRFLLQVLAGLGSDVLPGAARRLGDKHWFVIRNMLYLIREAGGTSCLPQINRFAQHEDPRVCMEAIKTLLKLGSPDALTHLRQHLRGGNADLREQAARIAGNYRYEAAVPDLLELLQKRDLFGTDAQFKLVLVKALAEIGNPRALPVLTKVYRSRTLLYRAVHDDLRLEIFRSLPHYPRSAIMPLLELGLQSGSEDIMAVCHLVIMEGESDAD